MEGRIRREIKKEKVRGGVEWMILLVLIAFLAIFFHKIERLRERRR